MLFFYRPLDKKIWDFKFLMSCLVTGITKSDQVLIVVSPGQYTLAGVLFEVVLPVVNIECLLASAGFTAMSVPEQNFFPFFSPLSRF
jgi:hypothetical protein